MSKFLLTLLVLLMFISTIHSQTVESFEGWIAYPVINNTEVYAPSIIGLINPETGEKRQFNVGIFGAESLVWSPDYTSLLFWQESNIHSLTVASGEITQLTDEEEIAYYAWSPSGTHIAYVRRHSNTENDLVLVDSSGNIIHETEDLNVEPLQISFAPDGRYVIFQANDETLRLYALDTETGETTEIIVEEDNGSAIEYGIIFSLYSQDITHSDLILIDFNAHLARRIIQPDFDEFNPLFMLENQKILYYRQGDNSFQQALVLLDVENREATEIVTGNLMGFDISPDGESLAYIIRHDTFAELCMMSLLTQNANCFDVDVFFYGKPAWGSHAS